MLCPACEIKMLTNNAAGGGENDDTRYVTFDVKECPSCGRKALEVYGCFFVDTAAVKPKIIIEAAEGMPA